VVWGGVEAFACAPVATIVTPGRTAAMAIAGTADQELAAGRNDFAVVLGSLMQSIPKESCAGTVEVQYGMQSAR